MAAASSRRPRLPRLNDWPAISCRARGPGKKSARRRYKAGLRPTYLFHSGRSNLPSAICPVLGKISSEGTSGQGAAMVPLAPPVKRTHHHLHRCPGRHHHIALRIHFPKTPLRAARDRAAIRGSVLSDASRSASTPVYATPSCRRDYPVLMP